MTITKPGPIAKPDAAKGVDMAPRPFNCPCNFRRTMNKDYVCWGIRCPMAGLEAIVEAEPSYVMRSGELVTEDIDV